MPAISFSTLKDKILSGEKKQTIRPMLSEYWLKFKKGDKLIGYWKMRTPQREKLFESKFSEAPFVVYIGDFDDELMRRDGFENAEDAMHKWFIPKYGTRPELDYFVVIRWQ